MDGSMVNQMSYFYFDPKNNIQMAGFHGLPLTPMYSRPTSACSPQAPTLYSNAPSMTPMASPQPMMKPMMMLETDFCNSPTTPLSLSGSALNSPAGDMLNTPMNPMFSSIDATEWSPHTSPPLTPSAFGQQSATPSFTSCPSLSPSPPPADTTEFLDPRNLTVASTTADLAASVTDDLFPKSDLAEDTPSLESFDFVSTMPEMTFDLPTEVDFSSFDMSSTTRPRACTGSSVVSLGNPLFETPEFHFDDSAFDLINSVDLDDQRPAKRCKASPVPEIPASVPSPAATEILSAHNSPATTIASPSLPSARISIPESSSSSNSSVPVPAPTSRRGRKQSLTEDPSKTFVCDLCNRRFRRQEHLKRHYRSLHTQEKPFECTDCGKKFSRSDNLAQHARTHGSGAIVMDLIESHPYEPMLQSMPGGPGGGDFSAYGKVLFQMPPEMVVQAAVSVDDGKKKRKRNE